MPPYNEEVGIEHSVRSIAASDYPDFEVAVVDDRPNRGARPGPRARQRAARSAGQLWQGVRPGLLDVASPRSWKHLKVSIRDRYRCHVTLQPSRRARERKLSASDPRKGLRVWDIEPPRRDRGPRVTLQSPAELCVLAADARGLVSEEHFEPGVDELRAVLGVGGAQRPSAGCSSIAQVLSC